MREKGHRKKGEERKRERENGKGCGQRRMKGDEVRQRKEEMKGQKMKG